MGNPGPQGMSGDGDPCKSLVRKALWSGDAGAAGAGWRSGSIRRDRLSLARKAEGRRSARLRVGGGGCRSSAEILQTHAAGAAQGYRNGADMDEILGCHRRPAVPASERGTLMTNSGKVDSARVDNYLTRVRAALR